MLTLPQILKEGYEKTPGAVAISCGSIQLDYARLFRDVERIAARLFGLWVGPRDVAAVDIDKPVSHWLITLALMRVGAVSVSLTNNCQAELETLPSVSAIVTGPQGRDQIMPHIRRIAIGPDWLQHPVEETGAIPGVAEAQMTAGRICFTSGTSGRPKAVLLDAGILENRLSGTAKRSRIDARSVLWCGLGPDTAYGFTATLAVWLAGGTIVLARGGSGSFAEFSATKVNLLLASPAAMQPLIGDASMADLPPLDATTIIAGGRLTVALRDEIRRRVCQRVCVAYGSSEAGGITLGDATHLDGHPGHVGQAFSDVQVEIVDDAGKVLPIGSKGLVRVRTNSTATGYMTDAGETRRCFQDGWFLSGDIAQMTQDSTIIILGRPANVLNLGGVKIPADDIEEKIRDLGDVDDVCAILLPPEHADHRLGIVVVAGQARRQTLGERIRAKLPTVPGFQLFMMDSLPRGSMGKINREVLAQSVAEDIGASRSRRGTTLIGRF